MSIKTKLEERLIELRNAETEILAQLWAIRGAIQEVETIVLPLIEEADGNEATDTESVN